MSYIEIKQSQTVMVRNGHKGHYSWLVRSV